MSKLRPSRLRLRFNVGRKRPQNVACFTISPRVRKNTVPPLGTFCIGAPGLRVYPNSGPTEWASLISHPSRIGVQDISRSKRFSHWPVRFQYVKCQPSSSSMRRRALRDIRSSMSVPVVASCNLRCFAGIRSTFPKSLLDRLRASLSWTSRFNTQSKATTTSQKLVSPNKIRPIFRQNSPVEPIRLAHNRHTAARLWAISGILFWAVRR
jgi:hypothetical protein